MVVRGVGGHGAEAGFDAVQVVKKAARGVGLLEEELGHEPRLAAGLIESAVRVLRTEHAEQGGQFRRISGPAARGGGRRLVRFIELPEHVAQRAASHDGPLQVQAHAEKLPAGVHQHGPLGGGEEGVDVGQHELHGERRVFLATVTGGPGVAQGVELGREPAEQHPGFRADVVAELAGVLRRNLDRRSNGAGMVD